MRTAALLAPRLLRALGTTWRTTIVGGHHLARLRAAGRPLLFLLWHGRILLPIHQHRDQRVHAMVSLSRDGDLTAAVLTRLGYQSVRGSSSRGGKEALQAMVAHLQAGGEGAVIPDGPRGPDRTLKPGSLFIAQESVAALLPLGASARPARQLRSWDRFLLPWPFARGAIVYGPPIEVPVGLDPPALAELGCRLEAEMNRVERQADLLVGRNHDRSAAVESPEE